MTQVRVNIDEFMKTPWFDAILSDTNRERLRQILDALSQDKAPPFIPVNMGAKTFVEAEAKTLDPAIFAASIKLLLDGHPELVPAESREALSRMLDRMGLFHAQAKPTIPPSHQADEKPAAEEKTTHNPNPPKLGG